MVACKGAREGESRQRAASRAAFLHGTAVRQLGAVECSEVTVNDWLVNEVQ